MKSRNTNTLKQYCLQEQPLQTLTYLQRPKRWKGIRKQPFHHQKWTHPPRKKSKILFRKILKKKKGKQTALKGLIAH